jgi:cytochrome c oxidase subunit II
MSVVRRLSRTVAGGTAAAVLVLVAGACSDERGAFEPRGPAAGDIDVIFWAMVVLGTAVFLLTVGLFVIAGARRRHGGDDPGGDPGPRTDRHVQRRHDRLVIGGGIVLPVVILVPLTIAMLVTGSRVSNVGRPGDLTIEVTGHQFWWEVRYPDSGVVTANEIHVPAGRPVLLVLTSADVIHSVWVAQLAGKIDMIPGETTELRIRADEPGEYLGHCAEFCGAQHARMRFLVIAEEPEEFDAWLADQAADAADPVTDDVARGAQVFADVGCGSCHAVRGTEADGRLGPDLTHVASRRTLGAATVPNTRGHLAGWVANPQSVKPGNLMPPTPVDSEQLLSLIAYLEALR